MSNFSQKSQVIIESFQKDRGELPVQQSEELVEFKSLMKDYVRYKIMNEQYAPSVGPYGAYGPVTLPPNKVPSNVTKLLGSLKQGETVESGPYKGLGRGALARLAQMEKGTDEEKEKAAEYGKERELHQSVEDVRKAGESEYFKVSKEGEVDPQYGAIAKEVALTAATALIPGGVVTRAAGKFAPKIVSAIRSSGAGRGLAPAAEKALTGYSKLGSKAEKYTKIDLKKAKKAFDVFSPPIMKTYKGYRAAGSGRRMAGAKTLARTIGVPTALTGLVGEVTPFTPEGIPVIGGEDVVGNIGGSQPLFATALQTVADPSSLKTTKPYKEIGKRLLDYGSTGRVSLLSLAGRKIVPPVAEKVKERALEFSGVTPEQVQSGIETVRREAGAAVERITGQDRQMPSKEEFINYQMNTNNRSREEAERYWKEFNRSNIRRRVFQRGEQE